MRKRSPTVERELSKRREAREGAPRSALSRACGAPGARRSSFSWARNVLR